MVTLLFAGNVAFHLEAHFHGVADVSIRMGIAIVVVLITMIGGRIIPSFTRNWLARQNSGRLPAIFGRFDMVVVAATALTVAIWVSLQNGYLVGALMALTGILHIVRLCRWAGDRTLRERLVLILHLGYSFIPLGFLLLAAAGFGALPASAGIHAWTVGAAGTMTLAVMTRATLGHTGQKLVARVPTQLIYTAVIIAALARICAAIEPSNNNMLLHVAAFAWAAAFLGFSFVFGRLLLTDKK
jgi:uncharacterized protein involved in response to NO